MCEAVHGSAVHDQLPIGVGPVHLLGECGDVGEWDVGVASAVTDEDPGFHTTRPRGGGRREAAVDADRGGKVRTRSRQREANHSAETESDGHSVTGRFRTFGQGGEPGGRSTDQQRRIITQSCQAFEDLFSVAPDAVAVHIAGQNGIAEFCVAVRLIARMLVQSGSSVNE